VSDNFSPYVQKTCRIRLYPTWKLAGRRACSDGTKNAWSEPILSMDFYFGSTEIMRELQAKIPLMARSYLPMLIEGETGTGKERLAQYLHELRAVEGRFVKFLCDSLPPAPLEGFDHSLQAAGPLWEAGQDTLLLKRIDRVPVSVQQRMLLLLDESRNPFPFLLSTTSAPIDRMAAEGRFLPELLYRVSAYRISLRPLRKRRQDIPELFQLMMSEIACRDGLKAPTPGAEVMAALMDYSWPGNIRELQNVARGYLLAPDAVALKSEIERRRQKIAETHVGWSQAALKEQVKQASKQAEGEIILRALDYHRWNRRQTAEALSISYRSLMYKMKNCNIRSESGMRRSMAH
jgi:DNA-binding NtrC family response regulator